MGDGNALVEYSIIGDKLEMIQNAQLLVRPKAVCRADCNDETGVSIVIVGGDCGSVRLLGADAFDASRTMEQPESGRLSNKIFGPSTTLVLASTITAVALLPDSSLIAAGHLNGQISFWPVEDGSLDRAFDGGKDAYYISCIDIGADGSVAVTGNECGTFIV